MLVLGVTRRTAAVIRSYALAVFAMIAGRRAGPFGSRPVARLAFTRVWGCAVSSTGTTALLPAVRNTEFAFRIQSVAIFADAFTTRTLSILTSNGARGYAETSQVLHMVREAVTGVGCTAQSIHTLLVAHWVTDAVVVNVPDVATTTTPDATQVWTRPIASRNMGWVFD